MTISSKKLLAMLSIIIFVAVFIIIANQFISNKYDLSLYEYIQYSTPITKEETEYLSEKGTLYFSSDINAPPFAYIEKDNGQYKGLVLDYVNALSIELRIDIEFVPQVWEDVISSVTSGNADMCDVFPSAEREKYLVFSEPIYNLRAIAITDSTEITNVENLSGHKVSIPAGDYAVEFVNKNIPNVEIVETQDLYEALIAFRDGYVDAVIGDEPVMLNFVKELDMENVYILDPVLYDREVCIGVNKSDTQLVNILNKGIFNMQKKNSIEKIQQKWFGISLPIWKYKMPEKLLLTINAIITILILIFVGMAIWSYVLKSEVKKRTDDLNKSKDNLQKTVDALNSFLICVDENGNIASVNKSFHDYMEQDNVPIEGNNYKDIPILNFIDIYQENQNNNEFRYKDKYFQSSISELEFSDYKYLIVIEEITDKKISQKQVLQQNKMIALGQLAAGVAHEIRNPLGLIQNYCYILKTYALNHDQLATESIDVIESSINRVDKIVNNLLEYSRKENDKFSSINLKETLTKIISFDSKLRNRNDIEVCINCKDDITFFTKAESINHIILNLLSNSADAMPYGGKISIDCEVDNNYLIINFKDNGTGISQENIDHIFNAFFSTKNVGQGTGLGLYITYNEVRKIGGDIQVESEIGYGTIFKMKFPIIKEMSENA
jgi:polar amino acid transport system substrate-binding protein